MPAEAEKSGTKEKQEAAPPKKSKTLLIAIIGVAVVGLGVGGFLMTRGGSPANAEGENAASEHGASASKSEEGGHGEKGAAGESAVASLDPFIVNLMDNSGTRYLKLTINLEFTDTAGPSEVTTQAARIRDSLIILLSSKSYADIGTVEGKYQMRDEIVARVNELLKTSKVKTVFFTDFVIQ